LARSWLVSYLKAQAAESAHVPSPFSQGLALRQGTVQTESVTNETSQHSEKKNFHQSRQQLFELSR